MSNVLNSNNRGKQFLLSLETQGIKLGLRRTQELFTVCGNPEKKLNSVQIIGTNGKGSTAATLSSILITSGMRVGLYTSPHLVDLSLAISISMLPSVLILSYFHGRPGKDKWNRIERIAVPTNLIVSTLLLFIFFYPKDLGAVTEDITVTDENGNEFTKTIISKYCLNIVISIKYSKNLKRLFKLH